MEEKSETVTTPPEINLPPGAVDKTSVSKNTNAVSRNINTCSKNITSNKKSSNKRRRKRSYRKNARIGNKFNKNRDVLLYQQRAQRRQLFFSDMTPGLVPYNTNSFLMAEHYPKTSPKFNYNRSLNVRDSHDSSSRSMSGSGMEEDEDFLSKEFRLDYENLRLEQLQGLSKEAVIQEILKLENQMESSLREKEVEIQTLNNKIRGGLFCKEGNLYVKFLFPSFLKSCRVDATAEA